MRQRRFKLFRKLTIACVIVLTSLSIVENKDESPICVYSDEPLFCNCSPKEDEAFCILNNTRSERKPNWHLLKLADNITLMSLQVTHHRGAAFDIRSIPYEYINESPRMKHFSFRGTHFKELPENGFPKLRHITDLEITDCKFELVHPKAIAHFITLKNLRMANNVLYTMPKDMIYDMPFLQTLDLRDNELIELANFQFQSLSALTTINLSKNNIVYISKRKFVGLKKLRYLNLSLNKIKAITNNTFLKLVNLRSLKLSGNKLVSLEPAAFRGMVNLIELYLTGNQLVELDKLTFTYLFSLARLNLSNNKLVTLAFDVIQPIYNNFLIKKQRIYKKELRLAGNDFECHCSLAWMYSLAENLKKRGLSDAFNEKETVCYFKVSCSKIRNCIPPHRGMTLNNTNYDDNEFLSFTKMNRTRPMPKEHIYSTKNYVPLLLVPVEALNCTSNASQLTMKISGLALLLLIVLV